MTWEKDTIRPKLKSVEVQLASGWVTVVSAPLSGQIRHICNVYADPAQSGTTHYSYVGIRTSGASGSESQKKIFGQPAQTPRLWGDDNIEHDVVQLKLGEELVGRTDTSGQGYETSLWWEE